MKDISNGDLHHRLRDRSQRLWVTGEDLLDNLLFREAADHIEQLVKESNRRLDLARSEGVARVIQFERAEAAEAKLAMAMGAATCREAILALIREKK